MKKEPNAMRTEHAVREGLKRSVAFVYVRTYKTLTDFNALPAFIQLALSTSERRSFLLPKGDFLEATLALSF